MDADRWCRIIKNGMSVGKTEKKEVAVRTPVRTLIFRARQKWIHEGRKREINPKRGLVRRRCARHPSTVTGSHFVDFDGLSFFSASVSSASKLFHCSEGASVSSVSPKGLTRIDLQLLHAEGTELMCSDVTRRHWRRMVAVQSC